MFPGRLFLMAHVQSRAGFPSRRSPWPLVSSALREGEASDVACDFFMKWFNTRRPCWKLVKGALELRRGIERPLSPAALLDGSVTGVVLFDKSVAAVKVTAPRTACGFEGLARWSVRVSLTYSFSIRVVCHLAVIPWRNDNELSGVKPAGTNGENINNGAMFRMALSNFDGAIMRSRVRPVHTRKITIKVRFYI